MKFQKALKKIESSKYLFFILFFAVIGLLTSCSTSKKQHLSGPEEYFNRAMEYFNDRDWLEAIKYLEVIRLQYPASSYADDAQFYLAEVYYNRKEFILSSYNYNMLRRLYPNSPFSKQSLYQTGMCFYRLSAPFDRDQEYSEKAIQSFAEFQSVYAKDSLAGEASKKIIELRNRLAEREYYTAGIYRKLMNPSAAEIYYTSVIDDFSDSNFYEDAFLGKIECLAEMGKKAEALSIIELYPRYFPNGKYTAKVREISEKVRNEK